jgi:hypothetical protein
LFHTGITDVELQVVEVLRAGNSWGALTWQLGEVWPTGGWGVVEYGSVGTVRVFRQKFTLEDDIGFHACSFEASKAGRPMAFFWVFHFSYRFTL